MTFFGRAGAKGRVEGGRNITFGPRGVGLLQTSDRDVASSLDLKKNENR